MRMVFDTNVLINGFQDDFSAPNRLLEAVQEGKITAVVTPRIKKEYRLILQRLIKNDQYRKHIEKFLKEAEVVQPQLNDIPIDDLEDRKFIEAALGGQADMIISNDHHLLDIGEVGAISIRTPQEAWRFYEDQEEGSSEWQQFITGLGIGR